MLQLQAKLDTKDLVSYFDRVANKRNINRAIRKALAKIGIEVRRKVMPKTPRDKGGLINSWKVESEDLSIEMGFDIVYAMYQHQGRREDGSHIIVNRPAGGETYFLKNAMDENYKTIMDIFTETLKNELIAP